MSGVKLLRQTLTSIPALVAGAVPVAERYVFGPRQPTGVADNRFRSMPDLVLYPHAVVGVKVTNAGTHASFRVTLEASVDGVTWGQIHYSAPAVATFTVDKDGILFAADVGTRGFFLPLSWQSRFPFWRLGLAGTGANGAGEVSVQLARV